MPGRPGGKGAGRVRYGLSAGGTWHKNNAASSKCTQIRARNAFFLAARTTRPSRGPTRGPPALPHGSTLLHPPLLYAFAVPPPSAQPANPAAPRPIAVLLSGSGRTLDNLVAAIATGALSARITVVIASRECLGAEKARKAGIAAHVLPGVIAPEVLGPILHAAHARFIVLAGYLKLLPIPPGYSGRVVNIHPALLPDFGGPGMHGRKVHEAVLASGAKVSGCTVHLCDERFDTGPIVLQRVCPVLEGDTPDTLAARVFEQECIAYPQALQRLIAKDQAR